MGRLGNWVKQKVQQVVSAPVKLVEAVGREVNQAVNYTADKIIEPVLTTTVKTIETVAKDPKLLAMVAISVAAPGAGSLIGSSLGLSGTAATIAGNTLINTAFNGGNLEAGFKSAIVPVVGGTVASGVAGELAKSGMNTMLAATVGNVSGAVAVSSLTGQTVEQAARMGVASSVPMVLNSNAQFAALPNVIKGSITAGVQAEVMQRDVNAAMIAGAVQGANIVGTLINQSPVLRAAVNDSRLASSFEKLTSSVVNASVTAAAQGKTQAQIDMIAEATLIKTSQQLLTSPDVRRSVNQQKVKQYQDRQTQVKEVTAAFNIGQLTEGDKIALARIEKQYADDPNMSLDDAIAAVKGEVYDSVATEQDKVAVDAQYREWKRYYGGDISDEDLRIAAESKVLSEKGYGNEVTIDQLSRQALDAQSAADQAAKMGLSYEAQRDIKNTIMSQDVSEYSNPNYAYDASRLFQTARYAAAMSLEYAKADATDDSPETFAKITSDWLMEQEAKDAKLWIQDQASTAGLQNSADVKTILSKIDSKEYNAAEAYQAFKDAEDKAATVALQGDPDKKRAYDDAIQHAKANGLSDAALQKQWATDVALGLKNYQDFETVKSLPKLADELKTEIRNVYDLDEADANKVAARLLSGELNYNDALTVAQNVSMSRELGYTSEDLAYDAPTVLDKGAELELKAINFESLYGINPETQEELDALTIAKNDIKNNIDPSTVYDTYINGGYTGARLVTTPATLGPDGVNIPVATTDYGTNVPVDAYQKMQDTLRWSTADAPAEAPSYTMPPVDYSLDANKLTPLGVDPVTGTGLTAPSALTNVSDLTNIDYGLMNQGVDYSGLGLKLPESPALKDMGGGQGLTAKVVDPVTGEVGTVGALGLTPEDAAPVLGDPKSFINNPEVTGTPVLKVDPKYLEPIAAEKPKTTAPTFTTNVSSGWMKTRTNLPMGQSAAATPTGASDGTEALPNWKAPMLNPGGLTSTYDPSQDYSFQSLNAPQAMNISQYSPLQQINPALQTPEEIPEVAAVPQQPTAGYYNYGVEKSPFSYDASPFYASASPQFAQLKDGGEVMASPLMATGGVPHKGSHYVEGEGGGQDDLIEARLADGEYVFDADIVSALGDGSNKEGAKKLDAMRQAIRKHKRSAPLDKIPPKAKSPLAYLKLGAR